MNEADELRAAQLRADEAARRAQIRQLKHDAIEESERGWRAIPFVVVDSLAAGAILGIRFALFATMCVFAVFFWIRFSVAESALLMAVPLGALLGLGGMFFIGPFRADRLKHHRLVVEVLLFLWLLGTLTFWWVAMYAAG